MRKFIVSLAVVTALASLIHVFWYLPALPDRVATHFGNGGRPDGFMSKTGYAILMTGILIGIPLFIGVTGFALRWLPDALINLPNEQYWLHPDRREISLQKTENFCWLMSALTSAFLMVINHLSIEANLEHRALHEPSVWVLLIVYLLATGAGIFWLYRQFPTPPSMKSQRA